MGAYACLLSGRGEAAIGIVEVFGDQAAAIVDRMAGRRPLGRPRVVTLSEVDELVLRRIPDGDAFTREPTVEICFHGGPATCAALLDRLRSSGVEIVDVVSRARRAVERGGVDALRAEAQLALPRARTRRTAKILVDQARGALTDAVAAARARDEVERLLETRPLGRALARPPRVAIAGPPNAGKSTLFNALLGRDRTIASPLAGTTRDPVEDLASFGGIPAILEDTAGLGDASDSIDREAVARTLTRTRKADVVICLVEGDPSLFDPIPEERRLFAYNKSDLGARGRPAVSALRGEGLEELGKLVLGRLRIRDVPEGAPVVFTDRQARWIPELAGPGREPALRELLRGRIEAPPLE
jgi:tRNA modification GTPase